MTSAQRRGNALPRARFGDLLVGFKYVADVLKRLERGDGYAGEQCSPDRLVLAAGESHGVIMPPGIRDKDAFSASEPLALDATSKSFSNFARRSMAA